MAEQTVIVQGLGFVADVLYFELLAILLVLIGIWRKR